MHRDVPYLRMLPLNGEWVNSQFKLWSPPFHYTSSPHSTSIYFPELLTEERHSTTWKRYQWTKRHINRYVMCIFKKLRSMRILLPICKASVDMMLTLTVLDLEMQLCNNAFCCDYGWFTLSMGQCKPRKNSAILRQSEKHHAFFVMIAKMGYNLKKNLTFYDCRYT